MEIAIAAVTKRSPKSPNIMPAARDAGVTRLRQAVEPECPQVNGIHQQIDQHHDRGACHQAQREILLGPIDFLGQIVGALPTAIRKKNRDHGRTERQHRPRAARRSRPRRRQPTGRCRAQRGGGDEHRERRHFEDDEDVQHAAAGLDSKVVHDREQHDGGNGQGHRSDVRPSHQAKRVGREGDRHGRDGAALDHEQERPAVHEARKRMPAVTQIDVLPTSLGKQASELCVREGAGERDRATGNPGRRARAGCCRASARRCRD